jgi:phosphoribosylanthranilate isomerase
VTKGRDLRPPVLKVCSVTTLEDARALAGLGVELVGLNFYPRSPRYLDLDRARALRRALGDRVLVVGVFVNAPPGEVARLDSSVGLDLIQFHGDEPFADIAPYGDRAIRGLRRVAAGNTERDHERRPAAGGATSALDTDRWLDQYRGLWAVLFDTPPEIAAHQASAEPQYGGTGRTWRWETVAPLVASSPGRRILVAGGISPANAATVLERVPGVFGLDVCSGVESSPGHKDLDRVAALLDVVRASAALPASRGAQPSGEPS